MKKDKEVEEVEEEEEEDKKERKLNGGVEKDRDGALG